MPFRHSLALRALAPDLYMSGWIFKEASINRGGPVFVELMPLLAGRANGHDYGRSSQSKLNPRQRNSFEKERRRKRGPSNPSELFGNAEELDRELGSSLASYVEDNLRLQSALATAKAEMEAAAKAAREQAKAKTVQSTKKQEDSAAEETTSDPAPADQNMTLFATQQK